jgi:hypothetical protein
VKGLDDELLGGAQHVLRQQRGGWGMLEAVRPHAIMNCAASSLPSRSQGSVVWRDCVRVVGGEESFGEVG